VRICDPGGVTRRRWLVVVGVVVVVAYLATAIVYRLSNPLPRERDVALPDAAATPDAVVAAYVAALDAHDCETADALWAGPGPAASWCEDLASITLLSTATHRGARNWATVGVGLDVDWRWLKADGSMDEGSVTWGYTLRRDGQGRPWRILKEGQG
jgi:hypothetical protein